MAINNIATSVRNSIVDVVTAAIDAGAGAGTVKLYTAAFAALLATMTFSDPSFAAASGGSATANAITDDSAADATGTAAVIRVASSTPTTVFEGTAGTSGTDLVLNTSAITTGDRVSISAASITMPAS
jgi:hypothetical protein